MDRQQYLIETNGKLGNTLHYKPIHDSIQPQTQVILHSIIQSLHKQKFITEKKRDYLYSPDNLLPKIHQEP